MTNEPFLEASVVDGDILVIILRGSLDSTTTEHFDREVKSHLELGRCKIIVDCRHLGFLSSLGIGSLVALQTRLRRQGGAVKLAAIQGPIVKVIRAIRLDKLLDIYGDAEFARQAFKSEPIPEA